MKSNKGLIFLIMVLFAVLAVLILRIPHKISKPGAFQKTWLDEKQLKYANMLLAKGLNREAALAFEDYIEDSQDDEKDLAKICYKAGSIYLGLYEYEKALKLFYKAEVLHKEAEYKQEINQKIIEALENLDMSAQAQYELEKRTSIGDSLLEKEGKVVARIGKEEVTEADINKAMDMLPEHVRGELSSEKAKYDFIKQYVTAEVLYKKAKKLGLDKTVKSREAVEDFRKQYSVEQLIQKEIDEKMKFSEEDAELYYKANQDKYSEPDEIKVSYVEITDKASEKDAIDVLKKGKGIKIENWIQKGQVNISDIGKSKETVGELFLKEKEGITVPFEIEGKNYVFLIDERKERRIKSYNEVKNQVEYEYKRQKQQKIIDALLKRIIEEQEVKIFTE